MNLGELLDQASTELDDTADPPLWPRAELKRYAIQAEHEACRRARLLIDSSTPAITQYALLPSASSVTLDPRVIFVKRAILSVKQRVLNRVLMRYMDLRIPGWENSAPSVPQAVIGDWETGKLRLWPPTKNADTLYITAARLPLVDMNEEASSPEINARFHESLIHWIKYRAYLKKDADTYDPQEAAKALALFEQEFGAKSSAI